MKWIIKKLISIMLIVMVVLTGFGVSKTVEAASPGDTVVLTNSYDENQANKGERYWEIRRSAEIRPGSTGAVFFYGYTDFTSFSFLKPKENYCLEDITIKLEPAAKHYTDSSIYPEPISELEAGKTYRLLLEQDTTIKYTFEEANVIYAYDDTNGHPDGFVWETFRPISKKLKAGDPIDIPDVATTTVTKKGEKEGRWVFTWTSDHPDVNTMPDPVKTITITGSWTFYEKYEVKYEFYGEKELDYPSSYDPNNLPETKKYFAGEMVDLSKQEYTSLEDEDWGIWEFIGWMPTFDEEEIDVDEDHQFEMPEGNVTVYGYWDYKEKKFTFTYTDGMNQTYYLGSNKDLEGFKIEDKEHTINPSMLSGLVVEGNGKHYYPERDVDYEVTSGSIKHNLKASFIEDNELTPGTYTIVAWFENEDFATINFKVANKPSPSTPKPVIPKTGIE